jgi:hypothetical protein
VSLATSARDNKVPLPCEAGRAKGNFCYVPCDKRTTHQSSPPLRSGGGLGRGQDFRRLLREPMQTSNPDSADHTLRNASSSSSLSASCANPGPSGCRFQRLGQRTDSQRISNTADAAPYRFPAPRPDRAATSRAPKRSPPHESLCNPRPAPTREYAEYRSRRRPSCRGR